MRHVTSERTAAKGGTVVAGLKELHERRVREQRRNRKRAAREGFSEEGDIGAHAFVLDREELSRAADAGLDLIGDQQRSGGFAKFGGVREVAFRGDSNS